jgi:hypothetical protein
MSDEKIWKAVCDVTKDKRTEALRKLVKLLESKK